MWNCLELWFDPILSEGNDGWDDTSLERVTGSSIEPPTPLLPGPKLAFGHI